MKFAIVTGHNNKKAEELAEKMKAYLAQKGQEVVGEVAEADVAIALGGDGTLIHSAGKYADLDVPFIGINVGNLGFLTAEEADSWQSAVDLLVEGKYTVSQRMTIEAQIVPDGGDTFRAVNEVVVKGMYRVVKVDILVNGQKFLSCTGDGVLVATQTGSTAYSLSAGGPIVDPELDCLLITPINAVGLPLPSVVLSPDDEIELKLVEGDDVSLVVDGQEHTKVTGDQKVVVSRGKHKVKLVYFDEHQFLKALNAKFGFAGRFSDE